MLKSKSKSVVDLGLDTEIGKNNIEVDKKEKVSNLRNKLKVLSKSKKKKVMLLNKKRERKMNVLSDNKIKYVTKNRNPKAIEED